MKRTPLPTTAAWLPGALLAGWLAALLALGTSAGPARADAGELLHRCPAQVRLNPATATLQASVPGFAGQVSDQPLPLTGASAFDGPPEEGAALKPAASERGPGGPGSSHGLTTWRFEGPYPAGKWMSCDYAQGVARLVLQLPPETARCVARTTMLKNPARTSITLACR